MLAVLSPKSGNKQKQSDWCFHNQINPSKAVLMLHCIIITKNEPTVFQQAFITPNVWEDFSSQETVVEEWRKSSLCAN